MACDVAYAGLLYIQMERYLIHLRELKLGVLACKHSGMLPLHKVT